MRIFDGHNDALSRRVTGADVAAFLDGDGDGHLDLPRAVQGGFGGGCFAIFPCAPAEADYASSAYFAAVDPAVALREALAQAAFLLRLERASGGSLRVVREAADLDGDGVLPAYERLDRRDRPAGELDDGLVDDPQLPLVDAAAQLGLGPQPGQHPLAQHVVEQLVAAAPALLRAVHRGVGVA